MRYSYQGQVIGASIGATGGGFCMIGGCEAAAEFVAQFKFGTEATLGSLALAGADYGCTRMGHCRADSGGGPGDGPADRQSESHEMTLHVSGELLVVPTVILRHDPLNRLTSGTDEQGNIPGYDNASNAGGGYVDPYTGSVTFVFPGSITYKDFIPEGAAGATLAYGGMFFGTVAMATESPAIGAVAFGFGAASLAKSAYDYEHHKANGASFFYNLGGLIPNEIGYVIGVFGNLNDEIYEKTKK